MRLREESTPGIKLVLVCDDSSTIRLLLVPVLERMGLRVIQASNGQEGLSSIRGFSPDLVISDINMPQMNGMQMMHEVRQDITLDTPHWIFMSSPDFREEAIQSGCAHFLAKPFSIQALENLVRRVLGGNDVQQQVR